MRHITVDMSKHHRFMDGDILLEDGTTMITGHTLDQS